MKLNRQAEKIQNINLTLESMITLGLTGFLIVLALLVVIVPQEEPIIETPGTVNLALPKTTNPIVYTDSLLPKENIQKR